MNRKEAVHDSIGTSSWKFNVTVQEVFPPCVFILFLLSQNTFLANILPVMKAAFLFVSGLNSDVLYIYAPNFITDKYYIMRVVMF